MPTESLRSPADSLVPGAGTLHRIRFVAQADGREVLREFTDPSPHKAVRLAAELNSDSRAGDGIDILTVPDQHHDPLTPDSALFGWVSEGAPPGTTPTAITVHGAQIVWGVSRAAILAPPDRTTLFLQALIDFAYHESQLRTLEREVSESWPILEHDSPLAYKVTTADSDNFDDIGRRMQDTLLRKMRLARITPHLMQPRPQFPLLANQLLDRLRERTHIEERREALLGQLDVYERIYEMNAQRISDYKDARQSRTLEWVIIVLLAAETLLLLIDLLWTLGV